MYSITHKNRELVTTFVSSARVDKDQLSCRRGPVQIHLSETEGNFFHSNIIHGLKRLLNATPVFAQIISVNVIIILSNCFKRDSSRKLKPPKRLKSSTIWSIRRSFRGNMLSSSKSPKIPFCRFLQRPIFNCKRGSIIIRMTGKRIAIQ